jgi:hypothetical protein
MASQYRRRPRPTSRLEDRAADVWGLVGLGDVLMVDVFEVGVRPNAGSRGGRLQLDVWATLPGTQLVLVVGDGVVEFADAGDDPGLGGDELAAGLLGGFEGSGFTA